MKGAFTLLDQFGLIEVNGAHATSFLHNQLTNDVQHLDDSHARLAGLCSQKGRLLATFLIWRNKDSIQLMLSDDIQAAVAARLSQFILRSKVKLEDVRPRFALVGLMGDLQNIRTPHSAPATTSRTFFPAPAVPETVRGKTSGETGTLIRLSDMPAEAEALYSVEPRLAEQHSLQERQDKTYGGAPEVIPGKSLEKTLGSGARYLWIIPRERAEAMIDALEAQWARVRPEVWDWLDIRAGEPRITAATQDQCVPQMLNFEKIGGIDFRKGCYPGQEVIARLQYRGVVRQRMMLAHIDQAPVFAGIEVFHSDNPDKPCGRIINAATAPHGGTDCLVQLRLDALTQGTLHMGAPDGPLLNLMGQSI